MILGLIGMNRNHFSKECKEHKSRTVKDWAVTKTSGPQKASFSGALSIRRVWRLERWNGRNYSMTCKWVGIPIRSDTGSVGDSLRKFSHLTFEWRNTIVTAFVTITLCFNCGSHWQFLVEAVALAVDTRNVHKSAWLDRGQHFINYSQCTCFLKTTLRMKVKCLLNPWRSGSLSMRVKRAVI